LEVWVNQAWGLVTYQARDNHGFELKIEDYAGNQGQELGLEIA
jgi:hypothetical protein